VNRQKLQTQCTKRVSLFGSPCTRFGFRRSRFRHSLPEPEIVFLVFFMLRKISIICDLRLFLWGLHTAE